MGRLSAAVRSSFLVFVLSVIAVLTGCSSSSPTRNAPFPVPANIALSPSGSVSLDVGSFTQAFTASPRNNRNTVITTPVSFHSSNTAVLTIANNGLACAGAWDSLTAPQICTPGPVGTAQVTATSHGVSSPPTTVYVHQHIDRIELSPIPGQTPPAAPCFSKGQVFNYQATALSRGLDITASVGPFTWQQTNTEVATIVIATASAPVTGLQPGQVQATARTPGTTSLIASVSNVNSSPFVYTTCAVQSISLAITGSGNSVSLTQGSGKTITATVTDTQGNTITGIPLTWCSSQPATVGAGGTATGTTTNNCSTNSSDSLSFTTAKAGGGTITASCTPPSCNIGFQPPLPIYPKSVVDVVVGPSSTTTTTPSTTVFVASTGVSGTNNCATAAGCVSTLIPIAAPSNTVGTAVALPATPNSLVFDRQGAKAFLGTDFGFFGTRGLMTVTTASPPVVSEFRSVVGKVLAVSPDGRKAIVSDTLSTPNLVYVFDSTNGTSVNLAITGATAADFSPDNLKAYILAGSTLYVYSTLEALKTIPLSAPAVDVSFLANGAYAYLAGGAASGVTARISCTNGTAGTVGTPATPTFLKTIPNATQVIAVDSPGIDVINVDSTPVGCPPGAPSHSVDSFNLGQGNFAAKQLLLSQDGARAYVIASNLGSVLVFNVGNQTSSAIPLAGDAIPIRAALTADGNLLYIAAADGKVHVLNTQTGGDVNQISFTVDPANLQGGLCAGVTFTCSPDLIAVRP